jgi:CDP-glycerol glycerophosphotransferase
MPATEATGRVPGQPLISIVIPVYNVQDDLPACLDSVLGPSAGEIEVIAVENGSTDRSGQILDDRAGQDGRLQVARVPRTGPGQARNIGLARAAGEYVWFVDSDDVLPPGSLQAVAGQLRQAGPDVLVIGFELLYHDGRTAPAPGGSALRAAPPGNFTIAQYPELLNHTMTAWSKIVRRGFLDAAGIRFPAGIHEDVPVSCAVLLGAQRISVLDHACYRYRQARPGSFMRQSTSEHFDVFRSYRGVLDQAAKRQADGDPALTAPLRAVLFERAIWHYAAILGTGGWGIGRAGTSGLVPRGQHRRFFEMMNEDFVKYRPEGYRFPAGARGAKLRLIARNAYWRYSLLEPVNRLRVRVVLTFVGGTARPPRPLHATRSGPGKPGRRGLH